MSSPWSRDREREAAVLREMAAHGYPVAELPVAFRPTVYRDAGRDLFAVVAREPVGRHDGADPDYRWHVSVQGPGRVPDWGELVDAAHQLRPGVPFIVAVPPRSFWMSVHPNVLHLWETTDANLIAEWRSNADAARGAAKRHTPAR